MAYHSLIATNPHLAYDVVSALSHGVHQSIINSPQTQAQLISAASGFKPQVDLAREKIKAHAQMAQETIVGKPPQRA
jgi:hypothetical protein